MNIKCMPGKIAFVLDPPEEKVGGGLLYKPDTAKGDNHIGTVIAVPKDMLYQASTDPPDRILFCVGDRIIVPRYAGAPVMLDGREIHFMLATDVLAVVTEEFAHAGLD